MPSIAQQAAWWDGWNLRNICDPSAPGDSYLHTYRLAQAGIAERYLAPGSTLEVGCGIGWLSNAIHTPERSVLGVDLSEAAIAHARQQYPTCTFRAGDFTAMFFAAQFQNVVSADVLAHVANQEAFVDRVAALLNPGGIFLLMTQNPFVWHRSSYLQPQGAGQLRYWPSLAEIRDLLAKDFKTEYVTGIVAGGDQGILKLVNQRLVRGVVRLLIGKVQRDRLFDHYIGRELVVVARRRA